MKVSQSTTKVLAYLSRDRGISPEEEWNRDSRPLVFIDVNTVGEAFLHHEIRHVDKGGCISFKNETYEVSTSLIGAEVEISYDPMKTDTLTVTYPGTEPITARKTSISAFCDKKPELPSAMQPVETERSRFLDVLEKKHRENVKRATDAISFGDFWKEGN